ncbi:MAG: hypothetical protein HQM12_00185 [SAR324 cluster bacterium]|nr:hypothetical protein [SAR324 cluster bacterium]MBF0351292.1 hypothetical protein [SAR324 cluster bacterium]
MKTAISIPDPIFESAEQLAKRMGISRSELYAKAVLVFVGQHSEEDITNKLNEIYSVEPSSLPHADIEIQLASIDEERW